MNKTKDGRFIEKRVKINLILLNKLIKEIKQEHNFCWRSLAKKLLISRDAIRVGWLIKGNTIPYSVFLKLINLHPKLTFDQIKSQINILKPYWGQSLGIKSPTEKTIKLPNLYSEEFAEFYGAMLGDGCIYSNLSGLCISGHSILDKSYLEDHICNLILRLFNIKPKFYYSKKQKGMYCVIYNKKLSLFFKKIGFPVGEKVNQKLVIPKLFFKNKILLKRCVRGLMDTDGSVYPQRNSKIIIDLSIKNKYLLSSCLKAFKFIKLDINSTKDRIYLCGEEKSKEFFRLIGSSNIKNILKYNFFIKNKSVPKTVELENYLNGKSGLITHGPMI